MAAAWQWYRTFTQLPQLHCESLCESLVEGTQQLPLRSVSSPSDVPEVNMQEVHFAGWSIPGCIAHGIWDPRG